ncbi:hypothetical protein Lalb_Chr10g0094441 [Lupinus albus]|uniref:Uncharacterized protein n=1 Tax=Lupinus albus TaxID=3870 RepID=A0A6A4PUL3_LUPAL|nr:hypothetical protein Lalb_Chr10g0094441 [Lupinus albus]
MSNFYMLSSRMQDGILGKVYGTCIIAFNRDLFNFNTIVLELLLHPKDLSATHTSGNVFCFGGGQSNTSLLFAVPCY